MSDQKAPRKRKLSAAGYVWATILDGTHVVPSPTLGPPVPVDTEYEARHADSMTRISSLKRKLRSASEEEKRTIERQIREIRSHAFD